MVIEQLTAKNVEVIVAKIDVLYNTYLEVIWKNTRTSA
jgi:hypothetical protein